MPASCQECTVRMAAHVLLVLIVSLSPSDMKCIRHGDESHRPGSRSLESRSESEMRNKEEMNALFLFLDLKRMLGGLSRREKDRYGREAEAKGLGIWN